MKTTNILLIVLVSLLTIGGSFGIGYKVGQLRNKTVLGSRFNNFVGSKMGQGGALRPGMGRNQIAGDITSLDDKSLTIKMADGSSKIILLSDSMMVNKTAAATKSDLKVGGKIAVFGAVNTDGSVTASSIELDPKFLGQL
jgi:hypothetical protein